MEKNNGALPVAFLRRLETMTEEEIEELRLATCAEGNGRFAFNGLIVPASHYGNFIPFSLMEEILKWLKRNQFDYSGLIEQGLAEEIEKPIVWTKENNTYFKNNDK